MSDASMAAMQLIGLMTVQQMEEMPGRAVVVCCCFDTFAALLEVVPMKSMELKQAVSLLATAI